MSPPVLLPLRKARRLAGFVGITAGMLPLYLAALACAPVHETSRVRDAWVMRWATLLLRLFAVYPRYGGAIEALPSGAAPRGRLVVANHRSALDVGILLRHFGGHMVSRADLKAWPVVGAAARSVGTVFVDRSSKTSGAASIRAVRDLLRMGDTVVVFPEGTTFVGDEVRPFQPGAFSGAIKTRATVVPVGIAYAHGSSAPFVGESFGAHLARLAGSSPTHVAIYVGEEIPVRTDVRAADLAKDAHDAVQALVARARSEVDGDEGEPRRSAAP